MKKQILPILATGLLFFVAACGPSDGNISADESTELHSETKDSSKSEAVQIAEENKVEKTYAVSGMVCEFGCAKFIEDEVSEHPGVAEFEVDFESETAKIVYDKSKTNSEEIIAYVKSLNEGKYSMEEIDPSLGNASVEKVNPSDSLNANGSGNADVSIPRMENFRFSFPKVITYFMRRL